MARTWEKKWEPVKGYEGLYEIHPNGYVRSVDRTIKRERYGKVHLVERRGVIIQSYFPGGTKVARYNLSKNGVCKSYSVLQLLKLQYGKIKAK